MKLIRYFTTAAAFKNELDKACGPKERNALLAKLTSTLESIRSPLRTAEAFGIEEMIDPRNTRQLACEARFPFLFIVHTGCALTL